MNAPIVLPWPLRSGLEVATRALFHLGDQSSTDFLRPAGEAALVSPDSVSWRVFKNPLSLFIGGVAAVIMELAEPRVRTGVWEPQVLRRKLSTSSISSTSISRYTRPPVRSGPMQMKLIFWQGVPSTGR